MAETTVEVVARAVGFEQLASEAQRATAMLKQFGAAARSIGSGSSFANSFSRDFSQIETRLTELRRSFRITGEYARGKLASGISLGLSESIKTPDLIAKFRATGEELGRAMRAGIQAGANSGGPIITPPTGGGGSGGSGRSNGGRPPEPFRHVSIDPIGGVVAGSVVGHAVVRGTESILEQAGAMAQVRAQLKSQGMTDAEIADVETDARKLTDRYRATSVPRLLQQYGEYRTVFGHPEEAKAFMPIGAQVDLGLKNLQAAESWARAIDPEQAQLDLAKAVELKGDAMNPAKAKADVDAMLKAIAAFKGQILPSDFLQAFKYARGSLRGFSDEFVFTVLPTLMAEFKSRGGQGGPAGVAMQAYYRTVLKGNLGKAKDEWAKLGLLDANGRVIDLDLARSDPPKWWAKNVSPKLAGMTSAGQKDEIARLFPGAISEQMATIFQNDAARLAKDAANIRAASGLDQMQKDFENAPTQAMAEFSAQFKNLLASLGDPAMPAAIGSMKGFAGLFSLMTQVAHSNPLAAAGIGGGALAVGGYAAYKILPRLLRSPLGRFAVGAISGGLLGGGLEALLFAGLLGATAPVESGSRVAPGLSRLRSVVSGVGVGAATGLKGAGARIAKWISNIGVLKTVLGKVGKLIGRLGTIGVAVELGDALASTDIGGGVIDAVKKGILADLNPNDKQARLEAAQARWKSNRLLDPWNIFGYRDLPPPTMRSLQLRDRERWYYQHHQQKMPHWYDGLIPSYEGGWVPQFRGPGARGSGGPSGPVPVVVQSMPKRQDRPNNVTTNVTVNVTTNASPQAIGGAVGSAVGSKVSNALSDQHH